MGIDERLNEIESDVNLNQEAALMAIGSARKDVVDLQKEVAALRMDLEVQAKLNAERTKNLKYSVLITIGAVITLGAMIVL